MIDWNEGKASAADQADAAAVFQETYDRIIRGDIQDEENQELLRRFIDVENYLDYCALNLIIDNHQWPDRMQAYAYIPAGGDEQAAQWRFLPHAMSNSFGLKAGKEAAAKDTLGEALNPDSDRYAPLFADLMECRDYRTYFVEKVTELLDDKLSRDSMLAALKDLNDTRNAEMQYYFTRIDALRKVRNSGVWMKKKDFNTAYTSLADYIKARPDAVREQLEKHFPEE